MSNTSPGGTMINCAADGALILSAPAIILDLDSNGIRTLSAADSNARFDFDRDGLADDTSWIGTTEGFLFLDRDGNGTVTNAGELNFLTDVAGAKSNLDGLKAFDSNNDGIFSALDARFGQFRIWQDRNGNGVAETGEIATLPVAGVRSINLAATASNNAAVPADVTVISRGSYTRTNGATSDYIDANLGYLSAAQNGFAKIDAGSLAFDHKAKKYRITSKDGRLTVTSKYINKDVDARANGLIGATSLSFRNLNIGRLSVIAFDLDGNGVSTLQFKKAAATFDLNGDGAVDDAGWISKTDGFLVIDRNNDGKITDPSELSFLTEDSKAATSFAALATLDNNGDRVIDKTDARFGELKIWVDANGDGVTDDGELKSLTDIGITSINLASVAVNSSVKVDQNILIGTATFTRSNGQIGTVGDVNLAYKAAPPPPVVTTPASITVAADQLANALATFGVTRAASDLFSAQDLGNLANIQLGANPASHV